MLNIVEYKVPLTLHPNIMISDLLMAIWKGICQVGPLELSRHRLHKELEVGHNKRSTDWNALSPIWTKSVVCTTSWAEVTMKETLTSSRAMELDHKLVESTEDGDLMLALNADSWVKENDQHKKQQQQMLQSNIRQQQRTAAVSHVRPNVWISDNKTSFNRKMLWSSFFPRK